MVDFTLGSEASPRGKPVTTTTTTTTTTSFYYQIEKKVKLYNIIY